MNRPAVIELRNVSCLSEDGKTVFEGASMTLAAGDRAVVLAPVASGKSSLIRLIAGLIEPDEGEVLLFGRPLAGCGEDERNRLRARMGFVTSDNVLISNLKVIENVALPILYHGREPYGKAMERAMELLNEAGFTGDPWMLPGPLPLYAKKEIAIARALALGPEAIVCENLLEGLTGPEQASVTALLLKYAQDWPERLLLLTANTMEGLDALAPLRVLKIEENRIRE